MQIRVWWADADTVAKITRDTGLSRLGALDRGRGLTSSNISKSFSGNRRMPPLLWFGCADEEPSFGCGDAHSPLAPAASTLAAAAAAVAAETASAADSGASDGGTSGGAIGMPAAIACKSLI